MENLPILIRIAILAVWMFVIPTMAGGCFLDMAGKEAGKGWGRTPLLWIGGQVLLWAGFQAICVPLVLWERNFHVVAFLFLGYTAILALWGAVGWLRCRASGIGLCALRDVKRETDGQRWAWVCWGIFAALLLLQLVLAVSLAYADGDDAYYVAISNLTPNSDTMYRKLPYTGGSTGIDIRHGLAPFPVWIAFLSWISGIRAAAVAHTAMPLMLIPMAYGIFYLLGKKLFPGKGGALPLFLVFTELLVIFGDYSLYTVEHFMITRSRQGKAALGSIIIPLLFWLLLVLYEHMQQGKKCGKAYWALFVGTIMAGSLCTTLGTVIMCLLIGIAGVCGAACYKKWRVLVPFFLCCLPCIAYILLYLRA